MLHTEIYASTVVETKQSIFNAIEEFSDLVIQLSMSGEFSDIDDLFDEGDEIVFSVKDFLHSNDERVKEIIKVLNVLRDAQQLFN
ncbi:hypothetical protein [Pedobacter borealis]|uniref:hypothetical protein n=1 Tax=Pedobacter borealis TaxID=475254 RepID=UPI0004937078|nr:hypothetical protein [Pedobacter borealis]